MAVEALDDVVKNSVPVDDFLDTSAGAAGLEGRDRSFLTAIVFNALRHREQISAILGQFLAKPLPRKSGGASAILHTAAAQILFLDTPAHAAIDTAVTLAKRDSNAKHFAGLINAVLRKVAVEGKAKLTDMPPRVAPWLEARWVKTYGAGVAAKIAAASLQQAPLDLTVKTNPQEWAERLNGIMLPTGTVRIVAPQAAVENLPGFEEGAWWVQDAASATPARLLGDVTGKEVLDLCAAPGGKTLQLAAAGAQVTAVDVSDKRLQRLKDNLARTRLDARLMTSDVLKFSWAEPFDVVLLDAPCSATGTIRRHPDLPYLKSVAQIGELAALQCRFLARAAAFVKPGGLFIYCTCSLEPDEGEDQIAQFLASHPAFAIDAITAGEAGIESHMIGGDGHFRSLPSMAIGPSNGIDGFFAARLRRAAR